ncbi:hypothetical protein QJS10_CPB18g00439 [Acorus calamus]|uniref:Gem-associated protein 2 n=1 Tax=Acorus calamus TaxID=4465 RepID=A0AAV9CK40_ACOCL|nr:hypothetical protein QJS10_CPB18g00439 [Acorus calamus]
MEALRFSDVESQRKAWEMVSGGLDPSIFNGTMTNGKASMVETDPGLKDVSIMDPLVVVQCNETTTGVEALTSPPLSSPGQLGTELNKRRYSRGEMEALRFLHVESQRLVWDRVFGGLESSICKEYANLARPKGQKPGHKNVEKCKGLAKDEDEVSDTVIQSKVSVEHGGFCAEVLSLSDISRNEHVDGGECCLVSEEPCVSDADSDDEYHSIQKPAFHVEGEPDFESGPPQDGLEYLRRVRWEAAQIPKVNVAKVDLNECSNKQTPYMPVIPEITKCPDHLLPSKSWVDAFLADFTELRQAFSRFESASLFPSTLKPVTGVPPSAGPQCPKGDKPTVNAMLKLDAIHRAEALRRRISSLETASVLSEDECLWLFALCVAIDMPLHAETSASLRGLLRKCASLRAEKSEPDDELAMLNVLATIAGKYFGQAEH